MYGLIIISKSAPEPRLLYSRFIRDQETAINQAEELPGVVAVEKAHADQPPIWVRESTRAEFERLREATQ